MALRKDKMPSSTSKYEITAKILFWFGAIIAILSVFLFLNKRTENLNIDLPVDSEILDHFGSFFSGSIGTIWSLVSVLLLYITLHEQRKTQNYERIEAAFFQLLNYYNQNIQSLNLSKHVNGVFQEKINGRDVYVKYYKSFRKQAERLPNANESDVLALYRTFFDDWPDNLGHTFRIMLQMIEYIDTQDISFNAKNQYINILKVQLNSYELALLYYNIVAIEQFKKYDLILEKYSFFSNQDRKLLIVT